VVGDRGRATCPQIQDDHPGRRMCRTTALGADPQAEGAQPDGSGRIAITGTGRGPALGASRAGPKLDPDERAEWPGPRAIGPTHR